VFSVVRINASLLDGINNPILNAEDHSVRKIRIFNSLLNFRTVFPHTHSTY